MNGQIVWFEHLKMQDVDQVGGKNASLGEMISGLADAGVSVPGGFATTAHAFREFLRHNHLAERIDPLLKALDVEDVTALAETGKTIRQWVVESPFPEVLETAVTEAYKQLTGDTDTPPSVAVRSSATAEDLPDASFAGQQETFLNVQGLDAVMIAIKEVFASLYNDRAISYRVHQGFAHEDVALSAGIQRMVRSDIGSSGVMFTLDTESGFKDAVFITSSYGLGETVVQGSVNPDEFYVHKGNVEAGRPAILRRNLGGKAIKMIYGQADQERVVTVDVPEQQRRQFSLTNEQVESLAQMAITIEKHYQRPMDIEWGLDGSDGQLYILQARPETVESRVNATTVERFKLEEKGKVLAQGRAIGQRIGVGVAKIIHDASEMAKVEPGDVLITDMTDPDWEPVMKRASAIVTNRGGRTCHAAIIARELGIPAVVGCNNATETLQEGQEVTVSCAEGDDGFIYEGLLKFSISRGDVTSLPEPPAKIMMNVANPSRAFAFSRIPNAGIGLARLEFIINTTIGVHPRALMEFDNLPSDIKTKVQKQVDGYPAPVDFYVEKLVEGISTLAAAFNGKPVIVRMSDFKSNEYANLIGGKLYEPEEENPMIGFRGASRYISESFRPCFELECRALKRVREEMGFENVEIMIPFVRTLEEAAAVIRLLEENGLKRGENGLRVIMMCELPSNAVQAEEFLEFFDGFSIGSNDMTQLTLGLDRDSGLVAKSFDERDPAVKRMLEMAIQACNTAGKYVGICGQGPSDYPDLAEWLVERGIQSVSLNPDTVIDTWRLLAGLES
ncbi:MAG: phosphoenolpyruvate synthase [Candidatus Thiodiazotropha endolucinida]|uniref:phosphoenolpyruvate synthase n=1 Tax=Candidatus Thiodiazotropha endolucinida TaxID=1655433 RepID=UPI0012B69DEA|nr:phosphoenolpyruvate synthase [Candidatus Thiodiazotropha endolucinida]MBT3011139.1 phosphoenolpyruvate synthase [Candidatus Thiodiazotropha sp. (ex Lucina pensylvanica)]MBT3017398.1 phosphoenolpyruvate synthase [Candidatus Thiodiazotropha taylori]MBT3039240.1 phosphoenolpyruvate synthase [Candidatus Thiodiazotropha sp. (ex Codakia orbicularis)]MBT3042588.1 phosphoenolpyruvate synthase [Candidatus Thiodiazotropha sp. (ex Codakia orbicularis)]MBV2127163.1 phosphoenolpyruvate synthase [Candida